MAQKNTIIPFSSKLHQWQRSKKLKTIESLNEISDGKSFAIIFLILMSIPALPIPTGGVTHVLELIVALLCLEMIIGRSSIWLPTKWKQRTLPSSLVTKGIPRLIKILKWLERYTRPRFSSLLRQRDFLRLTGLIVLILTTAAFVSPPFSGLDTLPSMGAVLIAIALLVDDIVLYICGCIVGATGIFVIIGLSATIMQLINRVF